MFIKWVQKCELAYDKYNNARKQRGDSKLIPNDLNTFWEDEYYAFSGLDCEESTHEGLPNLTITTEDQRNKLKKKMGLQSHEGGLSVFCVHENIPLFVKVHNSRAIPSKSYTFWRETTQDLDLSSL